MASEEQQVPELQCLAVELAELMVDDPACDPLPQDFIDSVIGILSKYFPAASPQPPELQSEAITCMEDVRRLELRQQQEAAETPKGFSEYLPLAPVRIAPGEYEVKARDGRALWRMDGAALADWVCASVNGYDAAVAALNPAADSETAAEDLAREIIDVIWGEAKKLAQSFVDANVRNYNDHKGVESLERVYEAKRDTAQQIVNQMHYFNEARWCKPKDITSRVLSALTTERSRATELQREVDAGIKFATVVPVGHRYSVSIGTREAGTGIRMCETLMDAKAVCDAINAQIAGVIRTNKKP